MQQPPIKVKTKARHTWWQWVLWVTVTLAALLAQQAADEATRIWWKWAAAQWMGRLSSRVGERWTKEAWEYWDPLHLESPNQEQRSTLLEIPTVHVAEDLRPGHWSEDLRNLLGEDWQQKPLLLKNLWDPIELERNASRRRLSTASLLQEKLEIPYFLDATADGALAPNGRASVGDIVRNMTKGEPHKIGSQLVLQANPNWIDEVAPPSLVKDLFGDRFKPVDVQRGAFGIPFLPPLTTVPLFVAAIRGRTPEKTSTVPFTALHCEPIANVAVQLEGEKQWTLVSPEYTQWLKPMASPDGRAYFVSNLSAMNENDQRQMGMVPKYHVTTGPGDALWIPTWTWHRVDYTTSTSDDLSAREVSSSSASNSPLKNREGQHHALAIGASLFHLRPLDLVWNHPLFAILVVPSLIQEVFGINTQ